ncbi:dienelactone hydrolase-like enzyme [Synechococcus sp. PCC 7502]|uniref:dienelactone hydrolase family protein n=1 Tax=Synechococcus sp. PCC 7502 TaxID=1173263 RepID=UPI00029F934B|nr:dienelactone hydrolase family protein [Synechococcus sp. PCC 7502]AFY73898.1 dienelactone hydrolase-like enzyme [Synechococcus sp. PCC 7502]
MSITRREFMLTSGLSVGFALATIPVSAQTIKTDSLGLIAGEVKIPVDKLEIPAYRAMPSLGENFPIVLVIQEIFGVHEHIQDICRRIAKLGYLAIAPELFIRQGDVSKLSDIQDIRKVVNQVPDQQVFSDLDATVNWAGRSKGNINRLAITGFCWGGRIVWLYSDHNSKVKAGVAWYGKLVGDATELTPKHPLDIAANLKTPILGLYGGADTGIPNQTVEQMQAALRANNPKSQIILYPDTPHAFFADYRPSYREPQAKDGWQRLVNWFKELV